MSVYLVVLYDLDAHHYLSGRNPCDGQDACSILVPGERDAQAHDMQDGATSRCYQCCRHQICGRIKCCLHLFPTSAHNVVGQQAVAEYARKLLGEESAKGRCLEDVTVPLMWAKFSMPALYPTAVRDCSGTNNCPCH